MEHMKKKTLLGFILSTVLFTTPVSAFLGSDSDNAKGLASIAVIDMLKINKDAKVMISLNKQKDVALDKIQKEVAEKRKTFESKEGELKAKQSVMDKEAFIKETGIGKETLVDLIAEIIKKSLKTL